MVLGEAVTKWHQSVGWLQLLRCVCVCVCPHTFTCPYSLGVHSTSWLCSELLQARATPTHTHRAVHGRRERNWVLKHWHFLVTAGLEGMVAAESCELAEFRKENVQSSAVYCICCSMNEVTRSSFIQKNFNPAITKMI